MKHSLNSLLNWLAVEERPLGVRWSIAAGLFVLGLLARFWVDPVLPQGFPYLTFFPVVIITTFLSGLKPGSVVAALCGLCAWYFFIAPAASFGLDANSAIALAFYAFIVSVDIVIIHGITLALRQLRAERERSNRLAAARETMFRELQHRISNNLQVVSSMIRLQRREIADPEARHALDEAIGRLTLISKIHRRLYDPSGATLSIGTFLREVCQDIVTTSAVGQTITCEVSADPLQLAPEQAIPLALLAGEFVANAIEHGYAGGEGGTVWVTVAREGEEVVLTVADAGAGLPENFELEAQSSIGLMVARQLAGQLGGRFTMRQDARTESIVRFPRHSAQEA